jgi:hypothetical protein
MLEGLGYTPGYMDKDITASRKNLYKQVLSAPVLAGVVLGVVPAPNGPYHPPQARILTAAVLLQEHDDLHDPTEPQPLRVLVPTESTAASGSYRQQPPAEPAEATLAVAHDKMTGRLRATWVVEGLTAWAGQPADRPDPGRQEAPWTACRVDSRRAQLAPGGSNDYRLVVAARRWWPRGRGQGRGA